jgi:hypothetical protein
MAVVTTIRLDLSRLREFEEWADQFPFAISRGMNWTAKLARDRLVRELSNHFTVRNEWTKKGIGIGPDRGTYKGASKHDLRLHIFGRHDYLEVHNTGGARPNGDQPISAVPIGARPSETDTTKRRSEWPLNLIRRGLAYRPGIDRLRKTLTSKVSKADKSGKVRTRTVRRREAVPKLAHGQVIRASKRHPTATPGSVLWYIADDAKINLKKRWPIDETVKEVFDGEFPDQLYRSIVQAVRTARRRR